MMKKITNKILSMTADLALETVLAAAGLASAAGTYQPEEPKNLKEFLAKNAQTKEEIN